MLTLRGRTGCDGSDSTASNQILVHRRGIDLALDALEMVEPLNGAIESDGRMIIFFASEWSVADDMTGLCSTRTVR